MINLRLPATHPNQAQLHKWAQDKEMAIEQHNKQIRELQEMVKHLLKKNVT